MGVLFALPACPRAAPVVDQGLPAPPDAVVEIGFDGLDSFVDVVTRLGAAGVIDIDPARMSRSGLEAAGVAGPVLVSSRATGGRLVVANLVDAVRLQAAVSLALGNSLRLQRRLGQVDAVVDAAGDVVALVRAGNGLVIIVIEPVDVLAEASLVEALATGALNGPRRRPLGIDLRIVPPKAWASVVSAPLTGTVTRSPDGLTLTATVPLSPEGRPLWRALSTPAPSMACAVEEGAIFSIRLPPVPGLEAGLDDLGLGEIAALDAFDGRLVVGVHPTPSGTTADSGDLSSLASLAVAGKPSATGREGLKKRLDEAFAGVGALRTVGTRQVRTVTNVSKPWRTVATVLDDDVFALGIGAVVAVDRVAVGISCPATPGRLLSIDGAGVIAVVERAELGLALLRKVGALTGMQVADPLKAFVGIERLEVDATPVSDSEAVTVQIRMRLRARK